MDARTSLCVFVVCVCVCVCHRRKDNETVSVRTLCHHPQQALDNIVLANYSSTECTMLPQPSEDGLLFVCGCVGDHECNDKLIFDKGAHGKESC